MGRGLPVRFYDHDSVDAEIAKTSQIGIRRLFRAPIGFHQAQVTLARTHQDDYRKDTIHLTNRTLTRRGTSGWTSLWGSV